MPVLLPTTLASYLATWTNTNQCPTDSRYRDEVEMQMEQRTLDAYGRGY